MAKKIEVKDNSQTGTGSTATPELNNVAFSITKQGHLYSVVRIKFDAETGYTGPVEVIKSEMGKAESEEVMKINVAREIFMKG